MKEQVLVKAWVSGNAGKEVKRITNILLTGSGSLVGGSDPSDPSLIVMSILIISQNAASRNMLQHLILVFLVQNPFSCIPSLSCTASFLVS